MPWAQGFIWCMCNKNNNPTLSTPVFQDKLLVFPELCTTHHYAIALFSRVSQFWCLRFQTRTSLNTAAARKLGLGLSFTYTSVVIYVRVLIRKVDSNGSNRSRTPRYSYSLYFSFFTSDRTWQVRNVRRPNRLDYFWTFSSVY